MRRQRETAEAVRLRTLRVDVGMGGVRDVRPSASAAGRGQVLAASELLEIAELARASTRLRRTFVRTRQETPLLSTHAAGLADLEALRGLIAGAVDERGEVRDSASRELQAIRRERDAVHGRLQQRMEALLRSASLRPSLQDPIVTLRDGRYVLPVRSEARSAVPGIVHDSSASGATIYVEPLAVIDLGNRWRELQAQERHEIERIMRSALRGRRRGRARARRRRRASRAARPRAGEGAARRAARRGRPDRGGERRALARRGARRTAAGGGAAPAARRRGRARHHRGGRRDAGAADHRAEHRRQDRRAQDRGPALADGPRRPARPGRQGHPHPGLRRRLRRHRRRTVDRAVALDVLRSRHGDHRHPRTRRAALPRAARRAGRRHRPDRGRRAGDRDRRDGSSRRARR